MFSRKLFIWLRQLNWNILETVQDNLYNRSDMVILIELSTISKVKTTDRRKSNHHRQYIRQRQQIVPKYALPCSQFVLYNYGPTCRSFDYFFHGRRSALWVPLEQEKFSITTKQAEGRNKNIWLSYGCFKKGKECAIQALLLFGIWLEPKIYASHIFLYLLLCKIGLFLLLTAFILSEIKHAKLDW